MEAASALLFGAGPEALRGAGEETFTMLKDEIPFSALPLSLPAAVVDVLAACGACGSKGEAKRAIRQGGVSVNEARVEDEGSTITRESLLRGRYLFVRLGRKRFHLAAFE